jgi:hypothetical protein
MASLLFCNFSSGIPWFSNAKRCIDLHRWARVIWLTDWWEHNQPHFDPAVDREWAELEAVGDSNSKRHALNQHSGICTCTFPETTGRVSCTNLKGKCNGLRCSYQHLPIKIGKWSKPRARGNLRSLAGRYTGRWTAKIQAPLMSFMLIMASCDKMRI